LHRPKPFAATVQQAFKQGHALVMICASGIAVRSLAPVLNNKQQDPPVLLLDEAGQFVVPLLSGHEGGANEWGRQLAGALNAQLVITTADPYLAPVYTVGMGCERGCSQAHLAELFEAALAQAGVSREQVQSLSSIDIKADEVGLIALADALGLPYQTYSSERLATVEHWLSQKSDYVFNTVGVYGVAESAALVAAQLPAHSEPELVLNKIKTAKATCAIARSYPQKNSQQDVIP
jgi:cobalt-precorrin 5A hydrolase